MNAVRADYQRRGDLAPANGRLALAQPSLRALNIPCRAKRSSSTSKRRSHLSASMRTSVRQPPPSGTTCSLRGLWTETKRQAC